MENLNKDEINSIIQRWLIVVLADEYNHIWNMSENGETYNAYYNHAYYIGCFDTIQNIAKRSGLILKLHNGDWYFIIGK